MAKKMPDDMTASEFHTTPTEELEHGMRCVLYEMVVLSLGLVQLRNKGEKFAGLPFGDEQTADSAAMLRARVLIEFFFPEKDSMPVDLRKFYDPANKWTTHLTWKRVCRDEGFPQPFPPDVHRNGMAVLEMADKFVTECMDTYGYRLTSPNARAYWEKFNEFWNQLKD